MMHHGNMMTIVDLTSIQQGVRGISHFLHHLYASDSISWMILISLRITQMDKAGCQNDLLQVPNIAIPFVTPTWITHLWPFMARHHFRITLSHP